MNTSAGTLRPIVEHLWRELGLAAPLEEIGQRFTFEIGEVPIALQLEANGDTVTLRGTMGQLDPNAHQAGDQLKRLLRIGLGLSAVNSAALDARSAEHLLSEDDAGPANIFAVATCKLSQPASAYAALEDVVAWHSYAGQILTSAQGNAAGQSSAATSNAPTLTKDELDELIIFQP